MISQRAIVFKINRHHFSLPQYFNFVGYFLNPDLLLSVSILVSQDLTVCDILKIKVVLHKKNGVPQFLFICKSVPLLLSFQIKLTGIHSKPQYFAVKLLST